MLLVVLFVFIFMIILVSIVYFLNDRFLFGDLSVIDNVFNDVIW